MKQIIKLDKSIIPSCDVPDLSKLKNLGQSSDERKIYEEKYLKVI